MKIFRYILLLLCLNYSPIIFGQLNRCGSETLPNSEEASILQKNRKQLSDWLSKNKDHVFDRKIVTIPVAVHIVWNTQEQNISDEQVLSQIEILNTDFRALNAEIPFVQNEFSDFVSDIEIEFCLANIDPQGNPTSGITRTPTNIEIFDCKGEALFDSSKGGKTSWGKNDYINIWVANLGSTLGCGTFPNLNSRRQGLQIHYKNFGNIGSAYDSYPYNLGRTATHEMGHFFNIEHIFSASCLDNGDGISDTPQTDRTFRNQCPTGEEFSCGTKDMYENFMAYTDDACMAMFTHGQKEVILATLNTLRPQLITSVKCQGTYREQSFDFTIVPNPANESILLKTTSTFFPKGDLKIYTAAGKLMIDRPDYPFRQTISVKKLESGVYFLDFRSGDNHQVLKFVKI